MLARRWISYLIAVTILFNFVDAALPQLEMWLLGGRCPFPAGVIKIVVVALLIGGFFLLKVSFDLKQSTFIYVNLFLTYCLFEIIYFSCSYEFSYVVFSFENYYFYMFLIPFFFLLRPAVPEVFWPRAIFAMTIVLGGLGCMQGYSNSAIVQVESTDGSFLVRSYTFFGNIRAFSLFGNSGTFGNFLCIAGAFMMLSVLRGNRAGYRMVCLLLLAFVTVVISMTLSRSVYNEYVLTLVSVVLVTWKNHRLIKYIPVIYGMMGLALVFMVPAIQALFGRSILGIPLLDGATQTMRLIEWRNAWNLTIYDPANFFLGTGTIQSSQYADIFGGSIDNIFFAIVLHIGIFGFVFYIAIMTNIWNICCAILAETKSVFSLACICVFSTWMMLGMFTIQPTVFPLIFLLALMSSGVYGYAKQGLRQIQYKAEPVVV